jgi:hypothetical protein
MTPQDRRFWIDLTAAEYLDALEREDFDAQDRLWLLAATDPDLEAAFLETHDAIVEESQAAAVNPTIDAVRAAVLKHLPGVELDAPTGPVTVAMVARELFERPPGRLSHEAAALNDRLQATAAELPADMGLTPLTQWLEDKYGPAPPEYAKAFRLAAIKLRIRVNSDAEVQVAARRTKPPTGGAK